MNLSKYMSIAAAAAALGLVGCEAPGTRTVTGPQATQPAYPVHATRFGHVESIQLVQVDPQATGIGAVGGAVAGGVVGRQVIGGTPATVGGAVVGGVVGHEVERRVRKPGEAYQFVVRLDDGTRHTFVQEHHQNLRIGDRVRVQDGVVHAF